jgi:hypothetical protein
MTAEDITQVISKLTEVGEKLAAAGQPYLLKSWEMLIRLTYIEAIRNISIGLLFILVPFAAFIYTHYRLNKDLASIEDDFDKKMAAEDTEWARVITLWIFIGLSLIGLIIIAYSIPGVFAPDAVTLKHLLQQ